MIKFNVLILILVLAVGNLSFAQDQVQDAISDPDKKDKNLNLMLYPFAAYSPETKLMGGVAGLAIYRPKEMPKENTPSDLALSCIYTQNKQFSIQLKPNIYFNHGDYNLSGKIEFMEFPDKFYGIGNNTSQSWEEDYTPKIVGLSLKLQRKILSNLNIGIGGEFTKIELKKMEPDGLMEFYESLDLAQGLATGFGG